MEKKDIIYVQHISNCINNIFEYIEDMNEADFLKNQMVKDAVVRNFEIIGEATKKLSITFREAHPSVEWKKMAGMRDKLIHDYLEVDYEVVWYTATNLLPTLKIKIEKIVNELS
ncbi:MAG: DUF86 domain-containing protein [Saprospiraceae bacterium]